MNKVYEQERDAFSASLLYYLGVLTMGGYGPFGKLVMRIPNLVVRRLYAERIQEMLLPDLSRSEKDRISETFYATGDIGPV